MRKKKRKGAIRITEKDMENYFRSLDTSDDPKIISIEDLKFVPKDEKD